MTEKDYIERVFRRISRGKPQAEIGVYRNAIQITQNDALRKFAIRSIPTGWRPLLEDDYTLAIAGTTAPFAGNTTLLPESIVICDNVRHAAITSKFIPVSTRSELEFEVAVPDNPFGYYYVTKSGIDFAYKTPLAGDLLVRGVRIPLLNAVDNRIEHFLIDTGVALAVSRLIEEGTITEAEAAEV